jgi:hypothetical protein
MVISKKRPDERVDLRICTAVYAVHMCFGEGKRYLFPDGVFEKKEKGVDVLI